MNKGLDAWIRSMSGGHSILEEIDKLEIEHCIESGAKNRELLTPGTYTCPLTGVCKYKIQEYYKPAECLYITPDEKREVPNEDNQM